MISVHKQCYFSVLKSIPILGGGGEGGDTGYGFSVGWFSTLVTAKTVYCPAVCLTWQDSRMSLQLTVSFELHSKSTN
jgi:hypothetical protein